MTATHPMQLRLEIDFLDHENASRVASHGYDVVAVDLQKITDCFLAWINKTHPPLQLSGRRPAVALSAIAGMASPEEISVDGPESTKLTASLRPEVLDFESTVPFAGPS